MAKILACFIFPKMTGYCIFCGWSFGASLLFSICRRIRTSVFYYSSFYDRPFPGDLPTCRVSYPTLIKVLLMISFSISRFSFLIRFGAEVSREVDLQELDWIEICSLRQCISLLMTCFYLLGACCQAGWYFWVHQDTTGPAAIFWHNWGYGGHQTLNVWEGWIHSSTGKFSAANIMIISVLLQ